MDSKSRASPEASSPPVDRVQPRNKVRAFLISSIILVALTFICQKLWAQAAPAAGGAGGGAGAARFYGEAALLSNWIEYGVSQTNKNYALQTGFGYQWPVLRLGIWGSNINYSGSGNLVLKPQLNFQVPMSQSVSFGFKYVMNQYYGIDGRNGSTLGVNLIIGGYNVSYEKVDKWLGIADKTAYGLEKDWPFFFNNTTLNLTTHYNIITANNYSNFFDVMPEVRYRMSDVFLVLGMSFNSQATQYNGMAETGFYLGLRAKF